MSVRKQHSVSVCVCVCVCVRERERENQRIIDLVSEQESNLVNV